MLDLQYPIGKFAALESYTPSEINNNIQRIADLPGRVSLAINNLSGIQLDTPYRDGGWTVRQVVHHLADSHMNAYIRLKWTLTEDSPLIKAYEEKEWAKTPETSAPTDFSINLLVALHKKWSLLLGQLSTEQFKRYFIHPQTQKQVKLETQTALYAWHGEHHLTHITSLKERLGW